MLRVKDLRVQYITNEAGEQSGVILSIEDSVALLKDLEDMALIIERQNEVAISHEALEREAFFTQLDMVATENAERNSHLSDEEVLAVIEVTRMKVDAGSD